MAAPAPVNTISIGRVISRGVDAVGRNLLPFASVALLDVGLWAALSEYVLPRLVAAAGLADSYWAYAVPAVMVDFVLGNFLTALFVRSTILHLNGDRPDVAGSALAALGLLVPMVLLSLLAALIIAVGLVLLIVPGIAWYLALSVAAPVLIVERAGIVDALRRSDQLTRGSKGQILLLVLIEFGLIVALTAFADAVFDDARPLGRAGVGTAEAIFQIVSVSATTLIFSVLNASLYVELRTVKEGTPIERLAAVFD
jgi:hypothetical protein